MNLASLFAMAAGGPIPSMPTGDEPTVELPTRFFSCKFCGGVSVPDHPVCPDCHVEKLLELEGREPFDPFEDGEEITGDLT